MLPAIRQSSTESWDFLIRRTLCRADEIEANAMHTSERDCLVRQLLQEDSNVRIEAVERLVASADLEGLAAVLDHLEQSSQYTAPNRAYLDALIRLGASGLHPLLDRMRRMPRTSA